jgi:Flp pilus assembly protein TadG
MLVVAANRRRGGAVLVEAALVLPLAFFLILATVVGSVAVYRYQEMAFLAREGARYASLHGKDYQQEVGRQAATEQDIIEKVILPRAVALSRQNLTCTVVWSGGTAPTTVSGDVQRPIRNTVTVTVTYKWFPELFLVGPYSLTSSSTAPILF